MVLAGLVGLFVGFSLGALMMGLLGASRLEDLHGEDIRTGYGGRPLVRARSMTVAGRRTG